MRKHELAQAVGATRGFLAGVTLIILFGSSPVKGAGEIAITVLSSRPDMISGGDALIEIKVSAEILPPGVKITLNGSDVTYAFHSESDHHVLVGLVEGLQVGRNVLRADAGNVREEVQLTNYSITGPIVSGPHMKPFVCMTQESGLGPPTDTYCSARTKAECFYNARGIGSTEFKALPTPLNVPSDVAETTTQDGHQVPYVVRVESGTINRAIYRIAVLDDPRRSTGQERWSPGTGWNRRVVYSFGGGCGTNYNQGRNTPQAVLSDLFLSRGFAHITSTANVLGQFCNDQLSAETAMMLKEHFIERYGVPTWTVGWGASGGAIQQLLIAQNFPSLLDGLLLIRGFPDLMTLWSRHADCGQLVKYFGTQQWPEDKRRTVEGLAAGTCTETASYLDTIVATRGCGIPQERVYDPIRNPNGARCTIWDTNVNTYGRDPTTGAARRTFDNVGLQYGLLALNAGVVTKGEFLDLNTGVGGYDADGNWQRERSEADPEALRMAYATGRVNLGSGSLGAVPILSFRAYLDQIADPHDRIADLILRERLQKTNSRSDNYVSWLAPSGPMVAVFEALALDTMSHWLDALARDTTGNAAIVKVVRAKPARAVDACWDQDATRIDEPLTIDGSGKCNEIFPLHVNPRIAAGQPLRNDILKCRLQSPDRADYTVNFTNGEWRQLMRIFPKGVCDYGRPGVNQVPLAGTYLSLPLDEQRTAR